MKNAKQSAAFKREQQKKQKQCQHKGMASNFELQRYQKSEKDDTFSHYGGTLSASCKDCGIVFHFTGMPRINDDATAITLFMVPPMA